MALVTVVEDGGNMERAPVLRRPFPWVGFLLTLGLGLRLFHYLRDPSVWHDEAALIVNVLGKGFREQLGPLFFAEAAPPLFLWVERGVSLVLGDGTYALRLIPFLASCFALVLFAWVARRVLPAAAVPWAVLLMAGSDRILWHCCEAKPYSVDVLAAVGLMALYVRGSEWPVTKQCLLFAFFAPFVIFLCYPGCFVYGGLLVALLPRVWREVFSPLSPRGRGEEESWQWAPVLAFCLLVLAVFVSFGLLTLGPIHAQRHTSMTSCWLNQFPNWQKPWSVPGWMLFSTLDVGRYCFEPTGHALALLAAGGGIVLWRQGQRALVALLALPLGLALAASCFRAYPYGGARVEVYAAPGLALLAAVVIPPLLVWLRARARVGAIALAALLTAPLGLAIYHAVDPWQRADCAGAAAYILAHREPTDAVAGNHWEYHYYFRAVRPAYQPVQDLSAPEAGRLWLVMTGATPEEQQSIVGNLAPVWQFADERRFERTSVFLLTRASLPDGPSALPRSRP
jgi:hypothetical protein